jgi:predicted dienelactone hydrolase
MTGSVMTIVWGWPSCVHVTPSGEMYPVKTLPFLWTFTQYGNVAVTLTNVTGSDLPDGLMLNVGIGRPAGTTCTASLSVAAAPGDTPQVTGSYGPGVFCAVISDSGMLTAPVRIDAAVAHS